MGNEESKPAAGADEYKTHREEQNHKEDDPKKGKKAKKHKKDKTKQMDELKQMIQDQQKSLESLKAAGVQKYEEMKKAGDEKLAELRTEIDEKNKKLQEENNSKHDQVIDHLKKMYHQFDSMAKYHNHAGVMGITGGQYSLTKNESGKMGYCLLINNSSNGEEAEERMRSLHSRFDAFHLEVRMLVNTTVTEINSTLSYLAEGMEDYSCFVLAMISPGRVSEEDIYFYDEDLGTMSLRDLWTPFTQKHEEKRKPKLFFIEVEGETQDIEFPNEDQYPGRSLQQQHILIAHSKGYIDYKHQNHPFFSLVDCALERAANTDISTTLRGWEKDENCTEFVLRSTLIAELYFVK